MVILVWLEEKSSAYATRHIAKNLVAAGVCDEILVQVSYAIGVARPTNIYVNTYGTAKVDMADGQIAKVVDKVFDMRPYFIEKRLKLRTPIYSESVTWVENLRRKKFLSLMVVVKLKPWMLKLLLGKN